MHTVILSTSHQWTSFTQHTVLGPDSKTAGWVTKNGDNSLLETHKESILWLTHMHSYESKISKSSSAVGWANRERTGMVTVIYIVITSTMVWDVMKGSEQALCQYCSCNYEPNLCHTVHTRDWLLKQDDNGPLLQIRQTVMYLILLVQTVLLDPSQWMTY